MKRLSFSLVLVLTLAFTLAACTTTGLEPAATGDGDGPVDAQNDVTSVDFTGLTWELVSYGPTDNPIAALPGATAVFEDGEMRGSTSCNSYSTSYALDGTEFSVGPVMSTEMACMEPGIMDQESAFMAALSSASSFEAEDKDLTIGYAEGTLHFTLEVPPVPAGLEGNIWQLQVVEQTFGEAVTATLVPEGMVVTAVFEAGQISGETGCNRYGAPYQLEGEQITLDTMIMTEAMCAEEAQSQFEGLFLNSLSSAKSFGINGDQLIINFSDGRLFFYPQPESVEQPVDNEIKPPPATLTINGVSQISGIGTYCWQKEISDGTSQGLCADMIGIPTPPQPLSVAGSTAAQLTLPLAEIPSDLFLTVRPVSLDEAQETAVGGYTWWDYNGAEAAPLPLMAEQELPLDYDPGLYLLSVQVWWDGYGDVVYGFLVEVSPS